MGTLRCQATTNNSVKSTTSSDNETLGLESIADGLWSVLFGDVMLGRFTELINQSVTHVPGLLCYLCSRLFNNTSLTRLSEVHCDPFRQNQ